MSRLFVRRPSPLLADGELTHLDRVPVDPDLALSQWQAYVEAFRSRGWDIVEIAPADDQPDGVFVEDAVVVFGDVAVLCRAGAASRRGEAESVRAGVAASGIELVEIVEPGTLDGGDVLKVGRIVYVGASSRTNAAGIAQLRELLEPRGWEVLEIPVTKVLHLKSGVTALPDGTVVGYEPLVDDSTLFPVFAGVPEEHGTAVVVLDEGTVLMSADAPATAEEHRFRGLDVVTVDVSEFEKLEGCVTCLSVRLRD
ncbi:N(G),N(G)-dimethylarginine dimethylaminohydrolase [Microbacterium sp. PRF11]|uniref:dimethylargininase n=1 Tax=Microbacterium sp. PRF11 TaxID=2962593 RepID=UPI00288276A5|nr:dimethylargininase [Microbacterium sp. PRF11]MDT0117685.1 N(G),N(G)-dimethylarginine dimethylaminohydrolase [Microbacterium sp. PRF11]